MLFDVFLLKCCGNFERRTSVVMYRQWSRISKSALLNKIPLRTGNGTPLWPFLFRAGITIEVHNVSKAFDSEALEMEPTELLTTSTAGIRSVTLHLNKFLVKVSAMMTFSSTLILRTSTSEPFEDLRRKVTYPEDVTCILLLEMLVVGALTTAISISTKLFG